jgi:putative protein-disulfide isomerase
VAASEPILWYFADPMCSWCWGFAPVISAIKERYQARLKVALVLGGLRPHTRDSMAASQRAEILHHWRDVHERTGQPFQFEDALPEGFIYDTEPASRAVVAVSEIDPGKTFAMFKAIQHGFYAEGKDVTQAAVLADLAAQLDVDPTLFLQLFHSPAAIQKTVAHFHQARQWGVRGFPTLILQNSAGYTLVTSGWRPLEELQPQIEAWLSQANAPSAT